MLPTCFTGAAMRNRNLIAVVLAAMASTAAMAEDRQTLQWMALDLPPASMPVGGKPTEGIVDAALTMIFAEMPEVAHRIVLTPSVRAWNNLAEGERMCFVTAILTAERERIAYVIRTHLIPPLQLMVREDMVDKFPRNPSGEVLPAALFDRTDLRGLITQKRSYSPELDALLRMRNPKADIRAVNVASSGANLLQMVRVGRADYTIEYDFTLAFLQSRLPELNNGAKLIALPIAGTQPFEVGIACPRTEWGRAMIMRLDAIVARVSQLPQYQAGQIRWFSADTMKRDKKAQTEFYRERAKLTDPAKFEPLPAIN
jgi:uncharacterized protein (TIGR02285 family)